MRWFVVSVSVAGLAACTRRNPDACCNTLEECQMYGRDQIGGCALDEVCVMGGCVAAQCGSDADCAEPTPSCAEGFCVAVDAPPPRIMYIAFISDRDGNEEVYRMNPDGSLPTNLTRNPAQDYSPVWDPTGERIAFLSDRSGGKQLWVMDADGENVLNVSAGQADMPAWSPDGTHLAFVSNRGGTALLYTVNVDGSGLKPLTSSATAEPAWCEGGKIVYESGGRIFRINDDGSGAIAISTGSPRGDHQPVCQPGGAKVAFDRGLSFTAWDAYTVNIDGSMPTDITASTSSSSIETNLTWSPDGAMVAGIIAEGSSSSPNYGQGVFVVDTDGTGFNQVVTPPGGFPCWSPDGMTLAYEAPVNMKYEVYSVPRNGGNPTNLTNSSGEDGECSWRPK